MTFLDAKLQGFGDHAGGRHGLNITKHLAGSKMFHLPRFNLHVNEEACHRDLGQWVTATGATVCPAKSSDYYIYMPEVKVGAVNCLMITPKTRHVQVNLSNGQSEEWRVRRDAPVGGCPWFMRPNGMKVVLPYWCKARP